MVSFDVPADTYDRFMGRYSRLLTPLFADFAAVSSSMDVLDVGCGPGALTTELTQRVGTGSVSAVDPSEPFVAAIRQRLPGVAVKQASAEDLPFGDDLFDATLAQLVVHHMADPVAGVTEMARVTRPGGIVGACVWNFGDDMAPLSPFWRAVALFDPGMTGESEFAGASEGDLARIFDEAGLEDVEDRSIVFEITHESFEEWWQPFLLGVGPVGRYLAGLGPEDLERLADLCRRELPTPPFTLTIAVWAARGSPGS